MVVAGRKPLPAPPERELVGHKLPESSVLWVSIRQGGNFLSADPTWAYASVDALPAKGLAVPQSSVKITSCFSSPLKLREIDPCLACAYKPNSQVARQTDLTTTVLNPYQPVPMDQLHQLRKYLLVALAVFMLAGAQLVQSSPLHDHTRHSVDCGLCHLQLGDDVLLQPSPGVAFIAHSPPHAQYLREFVSFSSPSPYQGRAPPSPLH